MRTLALLGVLVLAVGVVCAQQPQPNQPAQEPQATQQQAPARTAVNFEFVSADTTANTLTFRDDKGQSLTLPVEGKAVSMLAKLKAGDKISLTFRDNDRGEHQAITDIKRAPAPEKKPY